ncbi:MULTISPECIES: CU044_2847 family protein [unclassified Streptomyces]|uniref:CU044_2847 family protein n=1 Tax=unclassified Streptomyces TaxID=2593676 RepID=UPI00093AFAFB|nr:CU044_2847 family protein [Streptomyces sp. CB02400]
MSQLMRLQMPDEQVIWATVDDGDGPSDSGLGERITEKLEGFQESLQVIASNVRNAVAKARPDEVSVEFGLELAAGENGIVAALAGGSGKAAFKVTLSWNSEPAIPVAPVVPPQPTQPPTVPPVPPAQD